VKIISQWAGRRIRCHLCDAIFALEIGDLKDGKVHTMSGSMLEALIADKGGRCWTECPNCNQTITVAVEDIPQFYRKLIVVKK
jgi:hypothetical protein